jgi:hypothetical protein
MKNHGLPVPKRIIAGLLLLAISASALAGAQSYSFQSVDLPFGQPGIDVEVQALWINNRGVITAQFQAPRCRTRSRTCIRRSWRMDSGTLIDIPLRSALSARTRTIADRSF